MKQLLILSGKGGTGKTTAASAFIGFSQTKAFADCDVDAPNLHLVTKHASESINQDFLGLEKAVIDKEKCTGCGLCLSHCRFEAIVPDGDKFKIDELSCEGCGACVHFCPQGAAKLVPDVVGQLQLYKDQRTFSTAELEMGKGNSGKLVSQVKVQLVKEAPEDVELAIIDGSPGIGCPVIASISGVDMVLIVTEPTLSGFSDLRRIVKTAQTFQVPVSVCINRYDISEDICQNIIKYCKFKKLSYLGKIPFDTAVSKAINNNQNLSEIDCPASEALKEVYGKLLKLLIK